MKRRSTLLRDIGERVRERRDGAELTQRALAERSGVSQRFLAQLEAGDANISVERLADVAAALKVPLAELIDPRRHESVPKRAPVIALLGLRGAGKSTIGPMLAKRLNVRFVELDGEIERAAGLTLAEIFELHGERYYRRVERETLARLLAGEGGMVLATGGSLVNDRETYRLLRRHATTVWLKARPEDHWNRVLEQGDQRPMAKSPHAMSELRALLAAREHLYAEADRVIDTSRLPLPQVVSSLLRDLGG
jgi:XRE family aerobic/anaerobic benzoate catabolism transcriptional regulator